MLRNNLPWCVREGDYGWYGWQRDLSKASLLSLASQPSANRLTTGTTNTPDIEQRHSDACSSL